MTTVTKFEVGKAYLYEKSYDAGYFVCIGRTAQFVTMQDSSGDVFKSKVSIQQDEEWTRREDGSVYLMPTGNDFEVTNTRRGCYLRANTPHRIGDELPKVSELG